MAWIRTPRPLHSTKWPTVTPWMTSLKLYARYGSTQAPGCAPDCGVWGGVAAASATCHSLSLDFSAARVLPDAENHELSGLHRRDADHGDDHARVDDVGGVGFFVAFDEEGLARRPPHKRPIAPHPGEEGSDIPPYRFPQLTVVRLEHDPAGCLGN